MALFAQKDYPLWIVLVTCFEEWRRAAVKTQELKPKEIPVTKFPHQTYMRCVTIL